MSKRLGKGVEIFEQATVLEREEAPVEIPEKTIYIYHEGETV